MNDYRNTDTSTNTQSIEENALDTALQNGQFDQRVCIHIHSIRKRLTDPGGVSDKALIDGIVQAKVLADDSAKEIESITHSQEKGKEEKTIVTIKVLKNDNARI